MNRFYERQGNWIESPYVRSFMTLRENPELCMSCVGEACRLGLVQILQKPSLVASWRKGSLGQKHLSPDTLSPSSPLQHHVILFILPCKKCSRVPVPLTPHPLRSSRQTSGKYQSLYPFALSGLSQHCPHLGCFSGAPGRFTEGFWELTLPLDLTWKDPECCHFPLLRP